MKTTINVIAPICFYLSNINFRFRFKIYFFLPDKNFKCHEDFLWSLDGNSVRNFSGENGFLWFWKKLNICPYINIETFGLYSCF